jgi:AcrR family transcriptional regulator
VPSSTTKKSKGATARRNGTRGPANAEALLAAARKLVLERGEHFTTQDLVKEAEVALQTFYRHFGGKDQLLIAVMAEMIDAHCESLRQRAAGLDDPVDRLQMYVTDTLSLVTSGASGGRFITSQHWRLHQLHPDALAAANRPFADLVQRELEAAQATGQLAPRAPARDAWIINQLVMAVFHYYSFADDDDAGTVAEDVWQFCLAAVGGPLGAVTRSGPRASRSRRAGGGTR